MNNLIWLRQYIATTLLLLLFAAPAAALDGVPTRIVPAPKSSPQLEAAEASTRLRVAAPVDLWLSTDDGAWETMDNGELRWRLELHAPGALHLGLALLGPSFPVGARMHLPGDDIDAGQADENGTLWLIPRDGDRLLLDVRMPESARDTFQPGTARVHYGIAPLDARAANAGSSGLCHTNTSCSAGTPWRAEIRSTARILVGGQFLCSAQLMNNTARNGDPLLLTADHCGIGSGSGRFPAGSVVVLWNFESRSCLGTTGFSTSDQQQGGTLIYRDTLSDVSLLRLNQRPPAAFNLHYAGWDASTTPPSSGAGIHHPRGDVKKISLYNTPASAQRVTISDSERSQTVDAWRVFWSRGVTEPGSSGSGLWNQDRRVTGVLSGGQSSCAAQALPDFYGRLEIAWNRGGALGTPLRRFLDPVNSNSLTLDGQNASSIGSLPPVAGSGGDSGGSPAGDGLLALLGLGLLLRLRQYWNRRPAR
jgi:lysyl endopeptidase